MNLRIARASDLDQFENLGGRLHAEHCREQFARGDAITIVVAEDDGEIVGKIHIDWEHLSDQNAAYLESLAVREDRRRAGVASQVMDYAEDLIRKRGLSEVQLVVEDFNSPARILYVDRGYVLGESTFCFYDREESDGEIVRAENPAVWMRKLL